MENGIIINNDDIEYLISCEKYITKKPYKFTTKQSDENRCVLRSTNGEYNFNVFISSSIRYPADFSVGLMYNDTYCLIRCNGFHGANREGFYDAPHHAYPHIHMLSVDDINRHKERDPHYKYDATGEYYKLNDAILYFFKKCNIISYDKYFNPVELGQVKIFDNEGGAL